ncbi:MAG: serine hydroxymethyltransferase [Candidatus Campbellbacteria bacterium]|nr:serine hydroxymethyltransferase [Candidatus Campbellbacteria bacterium]
MSFIEKQDAEVYRILQGEEKRQAEGLELIPSENYVSLAVCEALASVMTNKYSEGYPGKRYYGGQKFTDEIETLAIERAKKLFGAKFANVQPLSGAPANIATYFALLEPGDMILGMDLSHGGHLTHGHPVTAITKIFRFVHYKMKNIETGEIDYDALRATALKEKPKILLAGYSAYPRELDYEKFVSIAREVGAITVMDVAHIAGLIAGKVVKNPFDFGFDVMTTTTHKTLRGPRGGMILTRDNEEFAKKIDKMIFPGFQGGPHMNVIAAKAVAFGEALSPKFAEYSQQILKNAEVMADVFLKEDVRLITGGTSNHLVLADVFGSCGVTGDEAQRALDEVGITVNKNVIADDTRKPLDPSGIRFGTPAITTRNFKEKECRFVAERMVAVLKNHTNSDLKEKIHKEICDLAGRLPVPGSFI